MLRLFYDVLNPVTGAYVLKDCSLSFISFEGVVDFICNYTNRSFGMPSAIIHVRVVDIRTGDIIYPEYLSDPS